MMYRYWYNSKINDLIVEFVLSLRMNIVNNGMWYSLFFNSMNILWYLFHLVMTDSDFQGHLFSLSLSLRICTICGLSLIKFFPRTRASYSFKQEKKKNRVTFSSASLLPSFRLPFNFRSFSSSYPQR